MPDRGVIFSIGQGARSVGELGQALREHDIAFLIDVRSWPQSRHRPEFSRAPLQIALQRADIRYVFMGDVLGGRPPDPACYTDGAVDYDKCRAQPTFHQGLSRLRVARAKGIRICLMCSEGHPAACHRTRLIGAALAQGGVEVQHILPDGTVAGQEAVVAGLAGGQIGLFGDGPG